MSNLDANSHTSKGIDDAPQRNSRADSAGHSVRRDQVSTPDFDGLTDPKEDINLEFEAEDAEGTYANSVMIRSSSEEFVLDFIRMIPGVKDARLKSRVIVTPQHAKRLLNALGEILESVDVDRTDKKSTESVDPSSLDSQPGTGDGHAPIGESPSEGFPTVEAELLTATFSLSGEAIFCNEPWASLLGTSEKPWARLSEDDQDMVESAVMEAGKGSLVSNRLVSAQTSHREEPLPILFNFVPVYDEDGGEKNCQAVSASGEVLAEPPSWMISQTQRHRMETLGRMTMGVAHDLNNLLSGLIGHIELLKNQVGRASLTDSIRPSIETIETTAEDGAALIDKLQRYVRHDTKQHFEPVVLTDLIEDCITLTEPYWYNEPRRQGIEISVKTSFEDVPDVLGSASELREVFVNLILNAVQAMPEGGTLRFETFTNEKEQVCVNVSDTGIGMSDEVQQNIFEPLFTTKGDDGTGMGLAASYGIVQEHEGTIDVSSEPGEGTRFTLGFPPAEGAPPPTEEPSDEPSDPESVSVLVVDDEEMVRSTVTRLLSLNGHETDRASSGAEALTMFGKNEYDIVFTDFGMPEMTGAELSREIKDKAPDLPVILLTGYTETETAIEEVDGILSKPFKRDELESTIRKHVFSSA
jgi:signal transduction histidine kinase/CheY-like chemotaxis protein